MTIRALHIPADTHAVIVEVFGETAHLEIRPAPGLDGDTDDPVTVEVPARALVAALRAAWADVHEPRGASEPWRYDRHVDDHRRYGLWDPDERLQPGDLGDGDPDGYHDPTVVPFPYRHPVQPPRPPRSGRPWEPEEEVTVRQRWLAASPDADRDGLLTEIARAVERGAGGVAARLPRLGCDPGSPGCALRPWDGAGHRPDEGGTDAG
ncbi:hypothetical protein [Actinomycetospora aeridis]|uniref:Uncharacterized protein n=1 Tax=Actinomycetospora aeridis TaxID=3129231 RepID=A0ABU8NDJ8_9PSEU